MSQVSDSSMDFLDEEYRYAYAEDFLNAWIATQIVTLREQRGLNQTEFGGLIGTKQPGVSRLENVNHSRWKTETLKRIARALGVRLRISFETFGTLLEEDAQFSRENLRRPKFQDDPVFATVAIDEQTMERHVNALERLDVITREKKPVEQEYHSASERGRSVEPALLAQPEAIRTVSARDRQRVQSQASYFADENKIPGELLSGSCQSYYGQSHPAIRP